MRKLFVLTTMLFLSVLVFGQISVDITQVDNKLNCRLAAVDAGPLDLFFSISPDGRPQYGREVSWNLNNGTADKARHYYVRKGDYDSDDLEELQHNVTYAGSPPLPPPFPPNETPDVNMGEDNWIKLGTSWNFAADNYNIAIISITNQSRQVINEGRVALKIPISMLAHVTEVKIYNDWAEEMAPSNTNTHEIRPFTVFSLQPKEIRHIYVYIDLARRSGKEKMQNHTIEAIFEGYGSSSTSFDLTNPPHDPNELYLLNAIENSMYHTDCSIFNGHPVLEERCEFGLPYWYIGDPNDKCKPRDPLCWLKTYTLNYPYCHGSQEDLVYRIQCLNDGAGRAKDIMKVVKYDVAGPISPFVNGSFETEASSHDVQGSWDYPKAYFRYSDIDLPGLADPEYVWTYNECSASVTFKVKKSCNTKDRIDAVGSIEFFGVNGASAGVVETSHVVTEPNANPTYPVSQSCISCSKKRLAKEENIEWYAQIWSSNHDVFIKAPKGWQTAESSVVIFDVSGAIVKKELFSDLSSDELIHISADKLPKGLYFINLMHNGQRAVHKLITQ